MQIIYIFLLSLMLSACVSTPKTEYQKDLFSYEQKPSISKDEVRAVWIVRSWIKSKENIDKMIAYMEEYNLNTAIVQVRGLGDVLYKSKMEPIADEIEEDLQDPLAYFIKQAEGKNIKIQAWINVYMISKPDFWETFTKKDKHLVSKKPNWILKDQSGQSMLSYKTEQLEGDWMDGAYLNPAIPEVRKYLVDLSKEVLKSYPRLEGLHLDFIRYPYARSDKNIFFGMDDHHIQPIANALGFSAEDVRREAYLPAVKAYMSSRITHTVKEIKEMMEKSFKNKILTAAVWANKEKVYNNVFQDWPLWLEKNYLDQAYMMIYVTDLKYHHMRMEEFYNKTYNSKLVIGMGLYRMPKPKVIKEQLNSSRAVGAAGFCLFSSAWFLEDGLEERESKYHLKKLFAVPAL